MKLKIEKLSFGPAAIAHDTDGRIIFVDGAVPGDTVDAHIYKEEKRCAFASVGEIIEKGPYHAEAPCPLVGICGGCPWGNVSHKTQLEAKERNVRDALLKNAGLDPIFIEQIISPIKPVKNPWGYRNKIELSVKHDTGKLILGMHALPPHRFTAVSQCFLLPKPYQDLPNRIGGALAFALAAEEQPFRRISIRASARTRNLEVSLWGPPAALNRNRVARTLSDAIPATSIVRCLTKGIEKKRSVSKLEVLAGKGYWEERIDAYKLRFSAPSFAQANTESAEKLIEAVEDALQDKTGTAVDLFAGAGTFTLPLSARFAEVGTVESSGFAVRDLKRNAKLNRIDNLLITGGDAFKEFPTAPSSPVCILVDPPRSGLTPQLIKKISGSMASALIYVSCNPQTLARDIKRFQDQRIFYPVHIQPFEMFGQTYHLETIAILSRKA